MSLKQELPNGSAAIYQGQLVTIVSFNRNPNLPNRYNISIQGRRVNDILPCFLSSTQPTVLQQPYAVTLIKPRYIDEPETPSHQYDFTMSAPYSDPMSEYHDIANYLNS